MQGLVGDHGFHGRSIAGRAGGRKDRKTARESHQGANGEPPGSPRAGREPATAEPRPCWSGTDAVPEQLGKTAMRSLESQNVSKSHPNDLASPKTVGNVSQQILRPLHPPTPMPWHQPIHRSLVGGSGRKPDMLCVQLHHRCKHVCLRSLRRAT